MEPSLMLLNAPVLFLLWQIKMSAVKSIYPIYKSIAVSLRNKTGKEINHHKSYETNKTENIVPSVIVTIVFTCQIIF